MKLRTTAVGMALTLGLSAAGLSATQGNSAHLPNAVNAKLETREVQTTFAAEVRQIAASAETPLWIGYSVPANKEDGSGCQRTYLENPHDTEVFGGHKDGENDSHGPVRILLRVAQHNVEKIRLATNGCAIDAGGLRVIWLTNVKPGESVAWMSDVVAKYGIGHDETDMGNHALIAIAVTQDSSADAALATFCQPNRPEELRKKASFWEGATRGAAGFATLKQMAKSDPSDEVRSQVSFALYVSKEQGTTDEMIRMAKEDRSERVRSQAIFWLGQKAGKKAEGALTEAINNDPDTEVKKKAVFALSQMPKGEGVPKLIEVAQNNRNPEVRKQAMFWLGESHDPRALEFFEKVLKQ